MEAKFIKWREMKDEIHYLIQVDNEIVYITYSIENKGVYLHFKDGGIVLTHFIYMSDILESGDNTIWERSPGVLYVSNGDDFSYDQTIFVEKINGV